MNPTKYHDMNKILHMMMGAIGTGKSTYAEQLSRELEIEVLSGDKVEEESLSQNEGDIEIDIMESILDHFSSGKSFVLDGLNLNKKSRLLYMKLAKRRGYKIIAYTGGPGDEESLASRQVAPRGVELNRWKDIAESNKAEYEAPELNEGFIEINQISRKY